MKKIAVVEGNADNRLLLQATLEDLCEVREYEEFPGGLKELLSRPADLILPAMDGVEVLREIRANECLWAMPVSAVTSHAIAGDRERFLAAVFADYVGKPVIGENLLPNAIRQSRYA